MSDEPFTDEQMDIIAEVIAQIREEWMQAIADLRDKIDTHAAVSELRRQLQAMGVKNSHSSCG